MKAPDRETSEAMRRRREQEAHDAAKEKLEWQAENVFLMALRGLCAKPGDDNPGKIRDAFETTRSFVQMWPAFKVELDEEIEKAVRRARGAGA